jgi:chromosome segregation protein
MPGRLKSLELNGYKTFASRTLFEFADNITAIVGPNGSGKSNVADAIRWVLGEQSYLLLRGRRTDDMIFSGSELRSRAGMASATIAFDNSDGWLPIDFSEVAITRRAYRDGQNEYLINNQKVRLRDVSDLLAQSGLSERTYTVIGQGLVDAALSLKADERRRLFEEAAGIGLYRNRKEQALRRLDKTKRNLDRVQDILAELSPRLRSLQRQAKRAEEYKLLQSGLRDVLREWYGYHWHRIQRELTETQEVARIQEQRLEQARLDQEAYSKRLSEIRNQINDLRSQLNSWHRELSQLHARRETLSRDLAVSAERRRSLEIQKERLQAEHTRLEEELEYQLTRLEEAQAEVTKREKEVNEAMSQAKEVRIRLEERQQILRGVEDSVRNSRSKIEDISTNRTTMFARKKELEGRLRQLNEDCQNINSQIENEKAVIEAYEEKLREVENERQKTSDAVKQAELDLKNHMTEQDETEIQRKSLQDALTAYQASIARLEAKLEVQEQAETEMTGYASGARLLLAAAEDNTLDGVQGALSNFLEIPEELETATAAVLGNFVNAVIFDGEDNVEKALDLLEKEPTRAALLGVGKLTTRPEVQAPQIDGCLGVLSSLVKAPADIQPVVKLFLGKVIVVRDRRLAKQIAADSGDAIIVTIAGEVFQPSGAVYVDVEGDAGLLSRPRKQNELLESLQAARHQMRKTQETLAQIQTVEERLHSEMDGLERVLRSLQEEDARVREDVRNRRLKVDQTQQRYEWQVERQRQLETSAEVTAEELKSLSERILELEGETQQAEQELRSNTAKATSLSLEELRTQVAYWNAQLSMSENGLSTAGERFREIQRLMEDMSSRFDQMQKDIEALDEQQEELKTNVQELRETEHRVGLKISEFQTLIDPSEIELRSSEDEQEEIQNKEGIARQKLNAIDRLYTQAQIAYARAQESMDAIRQRIEDDFGLVDFEYQETVTGPTPLPLAGFVQRLPVITELSEEIEETLQRQRSLIRRMGAINPEAQSEYQEVKERFEFLTTQVEDLKKAEVDIRQVISELDTLMEREFRKTFDVVAAEFRTIFSRLFGGGSAHLILTEEEDLTNSGIDIETQLPGKRSQRLALLSGGERSLTAAALVFALLKASPTPFCVMDEVDAMLDEANVGRFRDLLLELSEKTQFVLITHNRSTVQAADVIYGITMGRDTSSRMIGLRLDEVDERYSSN